MAKKIIFVRHGEAMDDIEDRYGGWYDPDISPKGREQARGVGDRLKEKGIKPDIILSSPLKRALQTAEEIGKILGTPVEAFQYIKERNTYGLLCGLNKDEAKAKYPELVEAYENDEEVLGYEEYGFFLKRVNVAIDKLKTRPEDIIVCATHGKFLKALLKDVLKQDIKDVSNDAIIEIEIVEGELKLGEVEGVEK